MHAVDDRTTNGPHYLCYEKIKKFEKTRSTSNVGSKNRAKGLYVKKKYAICALKYCDLKNQFMYFFLSFALEKKDRKSNFLVNISV